MNRPISLRRSPAPSVTTVRVFILAVLLAAVTACGSSSNSSSGSSSSPAGKVDTSKWQTVSFTNQGLFVKLPPDWTSKKETKDELIYASPAGDEIKVRLTDIDGSPDADIQQSYDLMSKAKQNGNLMDVKMSTIGGLKGVEFFDDSPANQDDRRSHGFQTYRKFKGATQVIFVNVSTSDATFDSRADTFDAILHTFEVTVK